LSNLFSCPIIGCIPQSTADQFVQRFIGVLTHQGSDLGDFVATANQLLAANFQEISGSINSLAGFPVILPQSNPIHIASTDLWHSSTPSRLHPRRLTSPPSSMVPRMLVSIPFSLRSPAAATSTGTGSSQVRAPASTR
jgi:hypothetical protein